MYAFEHTQGNYRVNMTFSEDYVLWFFVIDEGYASFIMGNDFTHSNVFTGLERYSCLYEKSSIKPLVAPEVAAYNRIKLPPVMSLSG